MEKTLPAGGFVRSPDEAKRDWLALAAAGRDPSTLENAIGGRLYEGLVLKPVYGRADGRDGAATAGAPGAAPFVRGGAPATAEATRWRVIQAVDGADADAANARMKDDLAGGAHDLWLAFGDAATQGWAGALDIAGLDAMDRLFAGVELTTPHLYAWGGRRTLAGAALLAALALRRGADPASLRGSAGFDPLSVIAASGETPLAEGEALASSVDAALYLRAQGFALRPFLASGRVWRMAGGSAVHELAFSLAAAVSYWRALEEAGLDAAQAVDAVALCLTADADLFLTIARLRAARSLWARATEAAGLPPAPPPALIAEMSFSMVSALDANVNLLRGVAAAFGAALGGAQAVLTIPFDAALGRPGAFARRMARNTQVILQEESHLGAVIDAPGGSWYVESLTAELAERAWNEFRAVEAQGGLLAAIENGHVTARLQTAREAREEAAACGRDRMTGVNAFPDLGEAPLPTEQVAPTQEEPAGAGALRLPPAGKGERFAALVAAASAGASLESLAAALRPAARPLAHPIGAGARLAEPFERLRRASDAALARDGARPRVFLANLGRLAEFVAQATWARTFFAAGGVEAVGEAGFEDLDALAAAFRASGLDAVCLCAGAGRLAALPGAARALKAAGARWVAVTARAETLAPLPAEDRAAIDQPLHEGCNRLEILDAFTRSATRISA